MLENIDLQAITAEYIVPWGINILLAVIIFIVGRLVSRWLVTIIRRLLQKAGMDAILVGFICSITRILLLLLVLVASLNQLGVDTTSLIALIGAAGLAVGLSLQKSLQNFASGVLLIVFRPFKDGDYVEAAGTAGTVEKIGIFSTTLRSPDNREIIVPNGSIYGDNIVNISARETRRIDLTIGIGYNDDIRRAREILNEVIHAEPRILPDPEPAIVVTDLAESSVNLTTRTWVNRDDYGDVRSALLENIKLAFDDNGISIPFPQMDVHLQQADSS